MSKKLASLIIRISANGAQAEKELKTLEKKVNDFGKSMQNFGKNMSKYVTVPLTALAAASVKFADTQLQAEAKLLNALKGREDVQKRLMAQASELQSRSLLGDEAIIEQQAFLAALGLSEQQISATIEAAAQLSAALGIELTSAVKNLAKTYGGMTGELGESIPALKSLTKEQLMAGDAIKYVNDNYKGFAETAANTGAGALVQLKNKLGDLAEQIGVILLPALDKLVSLLSRLADWLAQMPESTRNWVVGIGAAVAAVGPLLSGIGSLVRNFDSIVAIIPKVGKALTFLVTTPVGLAVSAVGALIVAFTTFESKAERAIRLAKELEAIKEGGRKENEDYFYNLTMDMYNRPTTTNAQLEELKREYQGWIDSETNEDSKRNFQAQLRAVNDIISARSKAVEIEEQYNKKVEQEVGLIGKLQQQIAALEDKKLLATSQEEIGGINVELAKLNQELDKIKNYTPPKEIIKAESISLIRPTFGVSGPEGSSLLSSSPVLGFDFEAWKAKFFTMRDEMIQLVDSLNGALSNAFGNLASAMGEGIEAAITGDEFKPMQRLMLIIGDMLKQMGTALVAYATALEAFKEAFKNPWVALGAGLAAIAAGSVITGLAKKGIPKLATGGLAYAPTLAVVGDNAGAANDPEVIAPLSKLRNYMGGQKLELVGDIKWELRGDALRAVLNRDNVRLKTLG